MLADADDGNVSSTKHRSQIPFDVLAFVALALLEETTGKIWHREQRAVDVIIDLLFALFDIQGNNYAAIPK